MDIIFIAAEDIKKGQKVILDFGTGELSIVTHKGNCSSLPQKIKLQSEEEPNIIENSQQACPTCSEIECRDDVIGICQCCGYIYSRRLEKDDHSLDNLLI